MDTLLDPAQATPALHALIDLIARGALLLAGAWLFAVLLRRDSAATRHLVWTLALAGLLALPFAAAVVPGWTLPVETPLLSRTVPEEPPAATSQQLVDPPVTVSPQAAVPIREAVPSEQIFAQPTRKETTALPAPPVSEVQPRRSAAVGASVTQRFRPAEQRAVPWETWAIGAWLVGMMLLIARMLGGLTAALVLVRRSRPVTDAAWTRLAREVAGQLGIHRRVRLLRTGSRAAPMTWGLFRPVVLLPEAADGWDEPQRRAVLLHEMAHVRRWDCLTQTLAQAACALHWFNPLAWHAARRMRVERERACDDCVLAQQTQPSSYAEHLLSVARSVKRRRPMAGAVAMARPSGLEDRVRRVLDPGVPRRALGRLKAGSTAAAVLGLAALLAAFQPQPAPHAASSLAAPYLTLSAIPKVPLPPGFTARSAAKPASAVAKTASFEPAALASDTLRTEGRTVRWSSTLPEGTTLELKNVSGDLRAEPAEGRRAEVVIRREGDDWQAVEIKRARRPDGGITLCAFFPDRNSGTADRECLPGEGGRLGGSGHFDAEVTFTARVPAGVDLIGRTVSGDVRATDLQGNVRAHTVSGDVEVSTAGYATGQTVSGDVRVEMGRADWTGTLEIATVSGDITAVLPESAALEIEAKTASGSAATSFSVPVRTRDYSGATITGTLGEGGRRLHLKTVSGDVRLVNRARPGQMTGSARSAPFPRIFLRSGGTGAAQVNMGALMDSLAATDSSLSAWHSYWEEHAEDWERYAQQWGKQAEAWAAQWQAQWDSTWHSHNGFDYDYHYDYDYDYDYDHDHDEDDCDSDSLRQQKRALRALSDLPDAESIPRLTEIARTHPSPEIREEAVEELADKEAPEVAAFFEELLREEDAPACVQEEALEALYEQRGAESIPLLIEVARTSPHPEVREEAIDLLGESGDPRAADALLELVREQ